MKLNREAGRPAFINRGKLVPADEARVVCRVRSRRIWYWPLFILIAFTYFHSSTWPILLILPGFALSWWCLREDE